MVNYIKPEEKNKTLWNQTSYYVGKQLEANMDSFLKVLCLTFIITIGSANSGLAQDYQIGTGDVLNIGVWGYAELTKELIVGPDGKIAFPLVGEIEVTGKSRSEITDMLTAGLSRYVIDPKVTINVTHFRTTRVYVLGEVQKPGMYEVDKEHNLLDAISMAGGYTKDAAKKKVQIIRRNNKGQAIIANVFNLLNKGDLSQNYVLNEGDVVYLNDTGRIDFLRDILPWISGAYQVKQFFE